MATVSGSVVLHAHAVGHETALNVGGWALVHRLWVLSY